MSWLVPCLIIILVAFGHVAFAQTQCEEWLGKLASARGSVESLKIPRVLWKAVRLNETYCPKDQIRTGERSRALVALTNETLLTIDQKTSLQFIPSQLDAPSWIEIFKGIIYFRSRIRRSLEIKTPFVNAVIRGTEFLVAVEEDQTRIIVFEGVVEATNQFGSLQLNKGQAALTKRGNAPVLEIKVRPEDAVQWTLYYPPVMDYQLQPSGTTQPEIQNAMNAYRQGNLSAAFDILNKVHTENRNAQYYTIRAGFLLTVGRVDQALPDIENALSQKPDHSSAIALQSIIAVAQNKNKQALELARRATSADPQSASAQLALSYAYQSQFNLEKALESLKIAVDLAPEDALVWARLAELQLSVGDLDSALEAAKKAVALNPDLARTQSVLGFAELTQIDIDEAKTRFDQAIQLDPTDPLPWLGLGLAKIRQGNLDEGTEDIQIAASLDPDNSLIRSYLGKAFYEKKDNRWAKKELAIAKELDPKDPTPWFYDAIRKQTINRPVEALHDIQKAIELNDNRAVYRSRLLLDDDLAARSASLGRIYNDLGFQQLGLVEGWKSVNTDPGNYSAHRLLADNYAALPRHEIARVSELLQSQLLQPINITPIQPQLAESNLFILDGLGPADLSFNEFNPLFARNRLALQASSLIGNNDTFGDEVTQSGLWNNVSYSLGQFHFETDGFRKNNDLKQDIYNVFTQVSLSPNFSVQAEYRHRETKHGDLNFNFDLDIFDSSFRRTERTDTGRIGGHYKFQQHSDFIGTFAYQNAKDKQPFGDANTKGYIGEGQYQFHNPYFDAIIGGGYYDLNSKGVFGVPEFDTRQGNAYIYTHIRYPSFLTWTVGVSYDSLTDGFLGNFEQVNPKLGISWDLTPNTTLRLAWFRVLKRALIADQTIEPTQVAGFNQFFDDVDATESKRYGIAIDHKFSQNLYGGVEISQRDLDVPVGTTLGKSDIFKWKEELYRAYVNWTPHKTLAISVQYEREYFNSRKLSPAIPSTDLHLLPVTLSYFHTSGLFAHFKTQYITQNAELFIGTERDEFVLMDATIGYRLPKRYGTIDIGVKNLFDQKFNFQGPSIRTSRPLQTTAPFVPERTVFARALLSY